MNKLEACKIVAVFLGDFSCYDCAQHGQAGGPKIHHQYDICKLHHTFEDYDDGCDDFELNVEGQDYLKYMKTHEVLWDRFKTEGFFIHLWYDVEKGPSACYSNEWGSTLICTVSGGESLVEASLISSARMIKNLEEEKKIFKEQKKKLEGKVDK